jgi:hypothetical protein
MPRKRKRPGSASIRAPTRGSGISCRRICLSRISCRRRHGNKHGTEYGLKFPTLTGPEGAQAWVDDRIAEGSDFIKIIYEYGGDTGHGGRPSIDRATLNALVVAAHARGKLAVVHIHCGAHPQPTASDGCDTCRSTCSHSGGDGRRQL